MGSLSIKPGDKLIKSYYETLGGFGQLHIDHEMAVRSAFQSVLTGYGRKLDLTFVPEYSIERKGQMPLRVDGALLDFWKQRRGLWEAKDSADNLEKEIKSKIDKGYPTRNTIFQAPEEAFLYQHGVRQGLDNDIRDPKNLVELLTEFFSYREPEHEEWDSAVEEFKERIPEIAERAKHLIDLERQGNRAFRETYDAFYALCRKAINPNLSDEAVEKMLIQHLLTERIFRRVFHAEEFRNRNVIAAEIEKVIASLTSKHFSRDQFLSDLDRFYKAIERAADDKDDYSEKQGFLNTVYERFFQGYSPKEADTHGIVYTPQPIVDFMVRSVEDILQKEFGKSLADKGVHILDPFVGTGNFIVRVMRQIAETRKSALPYKYENELHCNEVMLLPYYIASMNIEHEYFEQTGDYEPFDGICLVDTFELAEPEQRGLEFMTEENTARVQKQKAAPIFVVVGNPPYNVGQLNENDNNKNRKYPYLDRRVSESYGKSSEATNKNALSDVYVKAFRWATDRIGSDGIIALVTNNGFLEAKAFDGMRKELRQSFNCIYHLNLRGDARTTGELRRKEAGNIFQDDVRVGVGITLLVRRSGLKGCRIFLHSVGDYLSYQQKREFLTQNNDVNKIQWNEVVPDLKQNWLNEGIEAAFERFAPMVGDDEAIFSTSSNGVKTNRDVWAYNFNSEALSKQIRRTIEFFNGELVRWRNAGKPKDIDNFVKYQDAEIAWSRDLKLDLQRQHFCEFSPKKVRRALYRPYVASNLYFDRVLNEEVYGFPHIFPTVESEHENRVIWQKVGSNWVPFALATDRLPDLLPQSGSQCFPFYTYDEDGSNRSENITDWALNEFREQYKDKKITKWDIFHYVYGVLHSPEYRERYAANLKRELPRIPYAPDFWAFAKAGERLANLHVNYEKQPEYPLQRIENPEEKISYKVTKMRLGRDKTSLFYNDFLTLSGIPSETYEYRLGNRSALEWVIDQYQVSTDKRSGITNDPNREDDPQYILRLIGQVIHVSLETVKIVKALPTLGLDLAQAQKAQPLAP